MNVVEAISKRRSIRKFLNKDIEKDKIQKILEAGILAPSPKNQQPWKFIVVTGDKKREITVILNNGLENIKAGNGLDVQPGTIRSVAKSFKSMEEAPVVIFILNTDDTLIPNNFPITQTLKEKLTKMGNIQAIGASIENMLLTALEYGIGSLWINNIFYTYNELKNWLNTDHEIAAAILLGYPDESPPQRPRKLMSELIKWI